MFSDTSDINPNAICVPAVFTKMFCSVHDVNCVIRIKPNIVTKRDKPDAQRDNRREIPTETYFLHMCKQTQWFNGPRINFTYFCAVKRPAI